jgi:hypothetical protein
MLLQEDNILDLEDNKLGLTNFAYFFGHVDYI